MEQNIIDGRAVSKSIKEKVREEVSKLSTKPTLAIVLVGDNPASLIYVNIKEKTCKKLGIKVEKYHLPKDIGEDKLINLIEKLNSNDEVTGILVQLPLPKSIDINKILSKIDPLKDVDGLTPKNVGELLSDSAKLVACTPKGIITLLKEYKVPIKGKNVTVIGRSRIVGGPVAQLLLKEEATVTICHSSTTNLKEHTLSADIIVVATGVVNLLTSDMVKKGCVVIDVGINKVEDKTNEKGYTLCGDVDFENVSEKASLITPVPGGVGPMTVASLMENIVEAHKLQGKK